MFPVALLVHLDETAFTAETETGCDPERADWDRFLHCLALSYFLTPAVGNHWGAQLSVSVRKGSACAHSPADPACLAQSLHWVILEITQFISYTGPMHQQMFSSLLRNVSMPWHFGVITAALAIYWCTRVLHFL